MTIETDYFSFFLPFDPLVTDHEKHNKQICKSATLENKHRKHSQKPIQNFTVQLAEIFLTCFTNASQKPKLNAQSCQLLRKYFF